MNYKVGDKVRIVDHWVEGCGQNMEGRMDKWLGKTMTIREVIDVAGLYRMKEDQNDQGRFFGWCWSNECIAGLAGDSEEKIVITHNKKDTIARYYVNGKCIRKAAAHCHKDDEFDFKEGAKIAFNRLIEMVPSPSNPDQLPTKAYVDEEVNASVPQFQIGDRVEYHHKDIFDFLVPKLTEGEAGTIVEIKVVSDWILYRVKFDDSYCPVGVWVNGTLLKKRPKYYTAKIVCVDNHHLSQWQVGKIYHVTDGKLENDDIPSCENKRYMSLKEINDSHFAQFIEVVD